MAEFPSDNASVRIRGRYATGFRRSPCGDTIFQRTMGWKFVYLAQFTALGVFCTEAANIVAVTPDKVQLGEQVEVAWQASPAAQVLCELSADLRRFRCRGTPH